MCYILRKEKKLYFSHVSVCPTFDLLAPAVVDNMSGFGDATGTVSKQMHVIR